jgi:DNA-binding GntR family transcriptional regulator
MSNRVYEQIRNAIVTGQIEDESELNQVLLAQRFGVSRVPVREALMRLEAEQLIAARPFQRYTVSSLSPEHVIELTEIREELEALAIRRAVNALKTGKLEMLELRKAAAALTPRAEVTKWVEADRAFHRLIDAGNEMAAELVDDIRVRIHRYTKVALAGEQRRRDAIREHSEILDALEAGQTAKAERLLRTHIGVTRELLAKKLRETESL